MENKTNNLQENSYSQSDAQHEHSQEQTSHVASPSSTGPESSHHDFMSDFVDPLAETPRKSKLLGIVVFLVVVALAFQFTGFWDWLNGSLSTDTSQENVAEETIGGDEDLSGTSGTSTSNGVDGSQTSSEVTVPGKGTLYVLLSSGVRNGAALTSGIPTVEINELYLHNPFKDSWVLMYEGVRPLDLGALVSVPHELISTNVSALTYDGVRLLYTDLTKDESENNVTAEFPTGISVSEGKKNTINVWFNLADPNHLELELFTSVQ